jgi:glycosyltransferase involved in cell wall biosynthesis
LKLIFTTDSIGRGGKERQMFILASYLLNKKYDVYIITKQALSTHNYMIEYDFDQNHVKYYSDFFSFKRIIKIIKPDIVMSWDTQTSFYNLLLKKYYKFIFINASIRHGIRLIKFSHLLRSLLCHLSPFVIANSESGLKANNLKVNSSRFILYNGIEPKFINKLLKTDIEILRSRLIPQYNNDRGIVFISVANFVPYKDYFTVFKSLSRLITGADILAKNLLKLKFGIDEDKIFNNKNWQSYIT